MDNSYASAIDNALFPRLSWDDYFMDIAKAVSQRATCNRATVGVVIVRDHVILVTGYNGSIRGLPHCDEVGHDMEDGHCVRTIHGEANALVQAAKHGVALDRSTLYTTVSPCWNCFKLATNAGVVRIVYNDFYRDTRIFDAAKALKIELTHLLHRNPDGRINNCALANGDTESNCQMCHGVCPDRKAFGL
jgi:dCMP deaminase